ncbi:hypothetical protein KFK09_022130 [Dendrobium nobile]|uniref:Retrotransposon gag domain-containing protein n=1 Tax=Dendrobium nobile TaxID=94219 RepID=A0A8T3AHP6_DENNO|nr:hypothetical protein KFK09_022130 [Dendrobium nobile]
MAEGSSRTTLGDDRSLDALWREQTKLAKQLEELNASFNRFAMKVRQGLPANRVRETANPVGRRATTIHGLQMMRNPYGLGRDRRRIEHFTDSGGSEEEVEVPHPVENSDSENKAAPFPHFQRQTFGHQQRINGEFRIKLDIPFFDGRLHIEDFLDWERDFESFFEYMEIPLEKQVKYVACRLKGGASAWWQQLLQIRRREGKGAVRSWFRMKQLLRGHYLPTDFEQMLYIQYQHCVQGNRTVTDYMEEFYRLSARNNLNESENQLVARYIGGLKENLQDKLELNSIWSLSQAVNLALKAEMQVTRHSRSYSGRRSVPDHSTEQRTPVSSSKQQATTSVSVGAMYSNPIPSQPSLAQLARKTHIPVRPHTSVSSASNRDTSQMSARRGRGFSLLREKMKFQNTKVKTRRKQRRKSWRRMKEMLLFVC